MKYAGNQDRQTGRVNLTRKGLLPEDKNKGGAPKEHKDPDEPKE